MIVNFTTRVRFQGRNGQWTQSGLCIKKYRHKVHLQPKSSMGRLGRTFLQIPLQDLGKVIEQLEKLRLEYIDSELKKEEL